MKSSQQDGMETHGLLIDVGQYSQLGAAINAQRERLFRAQAVAKTVACLLHQTYSPEKGEPDLAYCLNVVDEIIEGALEGLDLVISDARRGTPQSVTVA